MSEIKVIKNEEVPTVRASEPCSTLEVLLWMLARDSGFMFDWEARLCAESKMERMVHMDVPDTLTLESLNRLISDAGFRYVRGLHSGYIRSEFIEDEERIDAEDVLPQLIMRTFGLPDQTTVWFSGFELSDWFRADTKAVLGVEVPQTEIEKAFIRVPESERNEATNQFMWRGQFPEWTDNIPEDLLNSIYIREGITSLVRGILDRYWHRGKYTCTTNGGLTRITFENDEDLGDVLVTLRSYKVLLVDYPLPYERIVAGAWTPGESTPWYVLAEYVLARHTLLKPALDVSRKNPTTTKLYAHFGKAGLGDLLLPQNKGILQEVLDVRLSK